MKKDISFEEACLYIQSLPYKRNQNKSNINCVLLDKGGTCSTKHAFLKDFANRHGMSQVKLMLGIFVMNARNTPKVARVLNNYGLEEMPEAHNYLKINHQIHDYTRPASKREDFENDLLVEIEIEPDQIVDFKVNFHKNFLAGYLSVSKIPFTLDEFWAIREECIEALQQ